eukprot:TRINITY_DN2483_c0_g1_i10.p3 TRINITY_DN2483_c0_g1~~TRINITY_DN2483_c0_g1_i10.p3  ORF type:complete len:148 (-),score=1.83 TRINITY_DN2483_c0_g1_i10:1819-2262(-)
MEIILKDQRQIFDCKQVEVHKLQRILINIQYSCQYQEKGLQLVCFYAKQILNQFSIANLQFFRYSFFGLQLQISCFNICMIVQQLGQSYNSIRLFLGNQIFKIVQEFLKFEMVLIVNCFSKIIYLVVVMGLLFSKLQVAFSFRLYQG